MIYKIPTLNWTLLVGSEPRTVPSHGAVDARQNAPHNLRENPTSSSVAAHMYTPVKEVTMETNDFHVVYPKAAGVDVHKMQLTVSLSLCGDKGSPQIKTRVFSALADGLLEMTLWLGEHDIEAAVMEGTGIYWITPFEALEAAGIKPLLVNARQVKQLRGRKTDVADSIWLARVCQFGLCSPSHVPPKVFRELRNMNRHRRKLVSQRSSVRNRVQKVIDRSGIRIGGVLSDVFGMNGRRILDGLVNGVASEAIIASLSSHVSGKVPDLTNALGAELNPSDRFILQDLLLEHDSVEERIGKLDREIREGLSQWEKKLELLQTIPGIDQGSACAILVEIGPDIGVFPSAKHLASWSGVCSGNNESAGKRRSSRTRMGNKTLKDVLVECAHGATRTKSSQFHSYCKGLAIRRGYKRAIVATAHKLLRIVYAVLRDMKPYYDKGADYEALMVARNAPRWIRMLKKHGLAFDPETGQVIAAAAI